MSENIKNTHEFYALGQNLALEGLWKEALAAWEHAHKIEPQNVLPLCRIARFHREKGNLEKAYNTLNRALKHNAEEALVYLEFARVFWSNQQAEQAEDSLLTALGLSPEMPEIYAALGELYQGGGKPSSALKAYQKYLSYRPEEHAYWNLTGLLLSDLQEFDSARNAFKKALEISPLNPDYTFNLGFLEASQGDLQSAKIPLRQALQRDPKRRKVYFKYAKVLLEQRKPYTALLFLECLKEEATLMSAELWAELGLNYRLVGRVEHARAAYQESLTLEPNPFLALHAATLMPRVFKDKTEIEHWFRFYSGALQKLRPYLSSSLNLRWMPEIYPLAYLNRSTLEVLVQVNQSLEACLPEMKVQKSTVAQKIGVVLNDRSAFMLSGFRGVFKALAEYFELHIFALEYPHDTSDLKRLAYWYDLRGSDFNRLIGTLQSVNFGTLLYLSSPAYPVSQLLSVYRFAPRQLNLSILPLSTGGLEIDTLVSSRHFIASHQGAHFSERLQLTQNHFFEPLIPEPESTPLPCEGPVFILPQTLAAYHPDWDISLRTILETTDVHLLCFEGNDPAYEALKQRLSDRLQTYYKRVIWLPPVSDTVLLSYIAQASALLESPSFQDPQLSYYALSQNTPVIALKGELPPAQWASQFYTELGLSDYIARSESEYIELAQRCLQDSTFLKTWKEQLSSLTISVEAGVKEIVQFLLSRAK